MNLFDFIDCSGVGSSGKGAVVDLLAEYENFKVMPHEFEFDLFRIKGGLNDLRKDFYEDWSPIRSNSAYWKFIKLINISGNIHKGFKYSGNRYEKTFNGNFVSSSLNFLNSFLETEVDGYWPYDYAEISNFKFLVNKLKEKLLFRKKMYSQIKIINGQNFDSKLNNYLYELFFDIQKDKVLVLNNFLEPYNSAKYLDFFSKAKQIVVIRDPRDTFVSGLSNGFQNKEDLKLTPKNNDGHSLSSVGSNNLEAFISRTNLLYKNLKKNSHDKILIIRFEDLVLNYDETKKNIEHFLCINEKNHIDKFKNFDPLKSKENLMIWKKFSNQKAMDKIRNELNNFEFKDY